MLIKETTNKRKKNISKNLTIPRGKTLDKFIVLKIGADEGLNIFYFYEYIFLLSTFIIILQYY